MPLQVFELADVAKIIGIPKSRVKNWTTGRPFRIRPSVRSSFGKGSRNLFSRNDLNCFQLVKHLNDYHAPAEAIQYMLQASPCSEDSFWTGPNWVVITHRAPDEPRFIIAIMSPEDFNYSLKGSRDAHVFCFAVNLKAIVDTVSALIDAQKTGRTPQESEWLRRAAAQQPILSPPPQQLPSPKKPIAAKKKRRTRNIKAE